MSTRVRILLVEDAVADAAWIARELQASGLDFALTRVQTEAAFRYELDLRPPDLVLSDHLLPTFSGFRALEIVQQLLPGVPFIFVCGSNDPNMVARMFEAGATDYVFNHDQGDLLAAVAEALGVLPESPRQPPEPRSPPTQPELELALPPLPAAAPAVLGELAFCPHCRRAFNSAGRLVDIEDYCYRHAETNLRHQPCSECTDPRLARSITRLNDATSAS